MEAGTPALGLQSLSHWTTREVPPLGFLTVHLGSSLGRVLANHSRERGSAMQLEAAPSHQLGAL